MYCSCRRWYQQVPLAHPGVAKRPFGCTTWISSQLLSFALLEGAHLIKSLVVPCMVEPVEMHALAIDDEIWEFLCQLQLRFLQIEWVGHVGCFGTLTLPFDPSCSDLEVSTHLLFLLFVCQYICGFVILRHYFFTCCITSKSVLQVVQLLPFYQEAALQLLVGHMVAHTVPLKGEGRYISATCMLRWGQFILTGPHFISY